MSPRRAQAWYTSPVIHTVTLRGLAPGGKYSYRVSGDSRVHGFTVPAHVPGAPMTIGLTVRGRGEREREKGTSMTIGLTVRQ